MHRTHEEQQKFVEAIRAAAMAHGVAVIFNARISPGDKYFASRNTGVYLLTCKEVTRGYVVPDEISEGAYPYDIHECVKIVPPYK